MCFSVNYIPACLHVHTVRVQVYTYLCVRFKHVSVYVNAGLCVSLETALARVGGGEK